jgi:hypothetical protein
MGRMTMMREALELSYHTSLIGWVRRMRIGLRGNKDADVEFDEERMSTERVDAVSRRLHPSAPEQLPLSTLRD